MKAYKLTNKELEKWTKILGTDFMKNLWIKSRINLSSQQLDLLIAMKDEVK